MPRTQTATAAELGGQYVDPHDRICPGVRAEPIEARL
jgi:hypothetical protein